MQQLKWLKQLWIWFYCSSCTLVMTPVEKVRNFWINPYAHSRLSLVVAIKYIRAIFRFLTLLTVDMITCTIGDKFHRWTDLTDGWSGLWIEFQNNQHDLDTVVKNISHNWTEYENILKSSCFHMPSLGK